MQPDPKELLAALEKLQQKHEAFQQEITQLKDTLQALQKTTKVENEVPQTVVPFLPTSTETALETKKPLFANIAPKPQTVSKKPSKPFIKVDFEKLVGENLISKIGILVLMIGVGIGTKYAIDHQLISPLMRIVLGYLVGFGLIGFALQSREKYSNLSAVLLSGGMGICYFITYFAYTLYQLLPQTITFALMVVFTLFTALAALKYNKVIIAQIGLVGAYAIPFLLSNDSGNPFILFSYIALINGGILFLAYQKAWKSLYVSAFCFTWLIFAAWFLDSYSTDKHFYLAFSFATLFWLTFYAIFLSYYQKDQEKPNQTDFFFLVIGALVYFAFGYGILWDNNQTRDYVGLFTVLNGAVHFGVAAYLRQSAKDSRLFYVLMGLVLFFITIAIPVQLRGNWITIFWMAEAALLFGLGRFKNLRIYEKSAHWIMFIAVLSLAFQWNTKYFNYYNDFPYGWVEPILNPIFLTGLFSALAFGVLVYVQFSTKTTLKSENRFFTYFIPIGFIGILYTIFYLEIANYWHQYFVASERYNVSKSIYFLQNYDLLLKRDIWLIIYSAIFVSLAAFVNAYSLKSIKIGNIVAFAAICVFAFFFLTGLPNSQVLQHNYLSLSPTYPATTMHIYIRYILYASIAILCYALYQNVKRRFIASDRLKVNMVFECFAYFLLLTVLSVELMMAEQFYGLKSASRWGLTILWSIYGLALLILGIWKQKRYLRLGAIALFAVALLKLFLFDTTNLDTISKTILFVSIGVFLLLVSFLYNKYSTLIFGEDNDKEN